jgi:hypothetical protein
VTDRTSRGTTFDLRTGGIITDRLSGRTGGIRTGGTTPAEGTGETKPDPGTSDVIGSTRPRRDADEAGTSGETPAAPAAGDVTTPRTTGDETPAGEAAAEAHAGSPGETASTSPKPHVDGAGPEFVSTTGRATTVGRFDDWTRVLGDHGIKPMPGREEDEGGEDEAAEDEVAGDVGTTKPAAPPVGWWGDSVRVRPGSETEDTSGGGTRQPGRRPSDERPKVDANGGDDDYDFEFPDVRDFPTEHAVSSLLAELERELLRGLEAVMTSAEEGESERETEREELEDFLNSDEFDEAASKDEGLKEDKARLLRSLQEEKAASDTRKKEMKDLASKARDDLTKICRALGG